MNLFFNICIALSMGLIVGCVAGGIKAAFFKKNYSAEKVRSMHKMFRRFASALKYVTFLLLALGFVWCAFFLMLGIVMPDRADYANNMAELIVAVLTVISILFAFVEFLKRKDEK